MCMKKIAIIFGGQSTEHAVSIQSAFGVSKAIDYQKYTIDLLYISQQGRWYKQPKLDRNPTEARQLTSNITLEYDLNLLREYETVMPILHGSYGEDGTIQGLFEMLGVNYVGCGVYASAVSIDKVLTKKMCDLMGIPQVPCVDFTHAQWSLKKEAYLDEIEALGYPVFVKPPKLGSSIGITKAKNRAEVEQAVVVALEYGSTVLVEQGIVGREIEVAALGNEQVELSVVGEVGFSDVEYYDYETKYESDVAQLIIPAVVEQEIEQVIKAYAKTIYLGLGCAGLSRLDFFLTQQGQIFFNEINTFPGFTAKSMYPQLWEATGVTYSELIDRLLELSIKN